MTTGERIRAVRKELGLTGTEFGKAIGLASSTISCMEIGRREITERTIYLIRDKFGVREEWLRTGNGEMFTEEKEVNELDEFLRDASPETRRLMKKILALDEEEQAFVENIMDGLIRAYQKGSNNKG